MNDLDDLEDIESRLYSQVYHATNQAEISYSGTNHILSKPTNEMKVPGRRYFGPWSPGGPKFPSRPRYKSPVRGDFNKTDGICKNYGKIHNTPTVSINQVVVVSPKRPIVCLTGKQNRKARWKVKLKAKRQQKRENKLRRVVKDDTVITLSDSDNDDSCVLVDSNWPVLSVDSDEEKATEAKTDDVKNVTDDVIFVEPVETPIQVINLDEDATKEESTLHIHQERKELLSTPDSASNDFINNSGVELQQQNFNFSLHGSDFNNGDFVKPAARNETCETESSSSTTEANSAVSLMKTAVFSEIDFPRDDIFSENNLSSFGNFITPLRDKTAKPPEDDCSDSEEETQQITNQKNLPELSPMASVVPTVAKKIKKKQSMGSKYDLINSDSVMHSTPVKKKKKIKKKQAASSTVENNSTDAPVEDSTLTENIESEKKRKSSHLQDTDSENQTSKKVATDTRNEDAAKASVAVDETQKKNATVDEEKIEIKLEKEDPMENFEIVAVSSDAESVLSALPGEQDIQLNYKDSESVKDAVPSTSSTLDPDNFSVRELQLAMSNDPALWEILESDRFPSGKSRGRRCNRCKQYGHVGIRCTNKVVPKCTLCGKNGHYEPRCPSKMCTQCGQRSPYATTYCNNCFRYRNHKCHICSMFGHLADTCPDLWRRYHLTTEDGPLVTYDGPQLKEKQQLWCSGCAQPGHLEHSCRFYKPIYPPSDPYVRSYENVYDDSAEIRQSLSNDLDERNVSFEPPPRQHQPFINQAPLNQRQFPGYNYNQNSSLNRQFVNPFMDGVFVANQQNFFPPNVLQMPQNNFVSFENPHDQHSNVDPYSRGHFRRTEIVKRNNQVFFSSTAAQLQHFIGQELHRLAKLSLLSNKLVRELRKRPVPRRDDKEREEYYETLNMLLFGTFNLIDGQGHLERLKAFKRQRLNKVNSGTRRALHKSYCYIFGRDKHYGIDYSELLRRM